MTLEKPWAREFHRLLSVLGEEWGGERRDQEDAIGDLYFYPEYRVEREGRLVHLEVGEFPGGRPGRLESRDNVEYLRIEVPVESDCEISVSHEGFAEKFHRFFGLAQEFETGVEDFDRRYWLQAKSPTGELLLGDPTFQRAVGAIEPFALLTVHPAYVLASRMITTAEILEPGAVKDLMDGVLALAAIVGR